MLTTEESGGNCPKPRIGLKQLQSWRQAAFARLVVAPQAVNLSVTTSALNQHVPL